MAVSSNNSQHESTSRLLTIWYSFLHRWIARIYFSRIRVINPERIPKAGPVLYLGLHRNGAVDGFVYRQVLRHPTFLISTQLRKSWFARLFFHGIAVTRSKDEGDRSLNETSLKQCLSHLQSGGELFIFPEGTSSLGPRHLPFKSGAIWLLLDYLRSSGPSLQIIPLGIHYEEAWAFRSRVEVVVGYPISTELPSNKRQIEQVREMKCRIQIALKAVGINVCSEEHQDIIQQLSYLGTTGTSRSYFHSLKALEKSCSESTISTWKDLKQESSVQKLLLYQGVPLFSLGSIITDILGLMFASPVVSAAALLNLPPLLAGWFAGCKLADDRNVIALWRILVGLPVFALWIGIIFLAAIFFGYPFLFFGYAAVTWGGLKLYEPARKIAVTLHNQLRRPELQTRLLECREALLNFLSNKFQH